MSTADTIRWLVGALEQAAIPYMVVGSFASSFHGRPRTTHDLDVVIDPTSASFEAFLRSLDEDRFHVDLDVASDALRRRSMFNVIDSQTGWKVDIASAEDVVVAKLEWASASGSERQLDDVRGVLAATGDRFDFAYVTSWAETLGLADIWARARGSQA